MDTPSIPQIRAPTPEASPKLSDEPAKDDEALVEDLYSLSPFRPATTPKRQPPPSFGEPMDSSPQSRLGSRPKMLRHVTEEVTEDVGDGIQTFRDPFNFQTQTYSVGRPPQSPGRQEFGRRRGHKYARSSISHQIILEPTPRSTQLTLPTSLPIPTFKEFRASMTREQNLRWLWCFTHLLVAGYTQTLAHGGSLALTALSHLLFFDTLGACLCVAVDVGRNFEAWTRSSIRHPFGLERTEVVAGLAMAIILLFMGLDLVNHGLQHSFENSAGHQSHHVHHHQQSQDVTAATKAGNIIDMAVERVSPGSIDMAAVLAILSTLVSAVMLGNHARISRSLKLNLPSFLPSILRNPSHLLTLSCSTLLLLLPFLSVKAYALYDTGLGVTMAFAMILLGGRLCFALGRMLLMSYPGGAKREPASLHMLSKAKTADATISIALSPSSPTASKSPFPLLTTTTLDSQIRSAVPEVSSINQLKIFQVHHGLCVAAIKVTLRPDALSGTQSMSDGIRSKIRDKIEKVIRASAVSPVASRRSSRDGPGMNGHALNGNAGGAGIEGGLRWEITVQIDVDK